jgi:hypothetical protein
MFIRKILKATFVGFQFADGRGVNCGFTAALEIAMTIHYFGGLGLQIHKAM